MENNYGSCKFCNAKMVKSPKTGKVFCSEKCWLKNEASPDAPQAPTTGNTAPKWGNATDPIKLLADEIVGLRTEVREMIQMLKDQTGI